MKNPVIDQWDWAHNIYEALLEWKVREFDVKVSRVLQELKEKQAREDA